LNPTWEIPRPVRFANQDEFQSAFRRSHPILTMAETRQSSAFDGKQRKGGIPPDTASGRDRSVPLCRCGVSRRQEIFDEEQNADFGGPHPLPAVVSCSGSAFAQELRPTHFNGLINDYPTSSSSVERSQWEIHGQRSIDQSPEGGLPTS